MMIGLFAHLRRLSRQSRCPAGHLFGMGREIHQFQAFWAGHVARYAGFQSHRPPGFRQARAISPVMKCTGMSAAGSGRPLTGVNR